MSKIEPTEQLKALERNPIPTPDLLYHYTGRVDDDNLLRLIASELLYFSNPMNFNDPLDVRMPLQAIKKGEESPNVPIIATGNDGMTGAMNIFERDDLGTAALLSQILPDIQDETTDKLRVLCLTEASENNLMWSHYANGHRGICLGLNWKKFDRVPHKVHYQNELSLTEFYAPRFEWEVTPRARVKTTDWEYEKEWRIFSYARNAKEVVFERLENALESIVLGSQITRETQKRVIELLLRFNPKAKVFQADFLNGVLAVSELQILEPKNYFETNDRSLDKLSGEMLNQLFEGGDIDLFIEQLSPYFILINDADMQELWFSIITAGRLTRNMVLKNRIRRWCPPELTDRTKDSQYSRVMQDEFDVWQAYLYPFQKNGAKNLSLVFNFQIDSLSADAKKLFLRLGWRLARIIEINEKHVLYFELLKLCESNLRMAKMISNVSDVSACDEMYQRIKSK